LTLRGASAVIAAFVVAGCATSSVVAPPISPAIVDAPFAIDGRLSARRASDAVTANFTWRHAPPQDDLVVTTPLGQAVAEISGDQSSSRYELRMADGRREEASDWTGLTERALGAPVPVLGLSAWIGGTPRPGAPYSVEPDASGRATVLRQDGWEIVYAYADDDPRLPSRLQLTQGDLEIRIVVIKRR
jgi:outer membrane lipoprotein LolB